MRQNDALDGATQPGGRVGSECPGGNKGRPYTGRRSPTGAPRPGALFGLDQCKPFVFGGANQGCVQRGERRRVALRELEIERVVDRQAMRPGQRNGDVEAGLVVRVDGEGCEGLKTLVDVVGRKAASPLGDEQGVADFQVPMPRDLRLGLFQLRQRRLGPRFRLVVEEPGGGYRRVEDEPGYQRWPSWRAARISSVDMSTRFQPARCRRNRSTAAARAA